MSTDESSLLSVGSARNKWEQLATGFPSKEDSKNHSHPNMRPKSFLNSPEISQSQVQPVSGVELSESLHKSYSLKPIQPIIQSSPIPNVGPQLLATTVTIKQPMNLPIDISSSHTTVQTSSLEESSRSSLRFIGSSTSSAQPPSTRPKPAIGKKPPHLSGVRINKPLIDSTTEHFINNTSTPTHNNSSVFNSQTSNEYNSSISEKDANPTSVIVEKADMLKPESTAEHNATLDHGAMEQIDSSKGPLLTVIPKTTIIPPSVVVAPPEPSPSSSSSTNSGFVPPPFRQLTPVIPPLSPSLSSINVPAPPPSRPVTPTVPPTLSFSPPAVPPLLSTPAAILGQPAPPALPPRTSSLTTLLPNTSSQPSVVSVKSHLPDPSNFMPPPPLPRLNPAINATPLSTYSSQIPEQPPIPSGSPVPPLPPPSRRLNHSISDTNLNGDSLKSSPLPSPSENGHPSQRTQMHIHQPQPRQPLASGYGSQHPTLSPSPNTLLPIPLPQPSLPVHGLQQAQQPLSQPTNQQRQQPYQPPPPPQRMDYFANVYTPSRSSTELVLSTATRKSSVPNNSDYSSGAEEAAYDSDEGNSLNMTAEYSTYPDSSQANRRAPIFGGPQHEISTKHRVEAIAISGTTLIISSHATKVVDIQSGEVLWTLSHSDIKVSAIGFKPTSVPHISGSVFWLGTKEGHLWEVDLHQQAVLHKRSNAHMAAIVAIQSVGNSLWTISEDGKICLWESNITDTPKTYRMTPNFKAFCIDSDQIWLGRNRQVHVYHPTFSGEETFNITSRPISCFPLGVGKIGGEFTCATTIKRHPDSIYFGHEDGTITVFSRSRGMAVESVNISIHKICAMTGVGTNLWIGLKTGHIYVVDVGAKPWRIMKEWKGHEASIRAITSNESSFFAAQKNGYMPVVSIGPEANVLLWDGLLKADWIENDMQIHTEEFCSYRDIDVLNITWNAGAARPTDLDRSDADKKFLSNAFAHYCEKAPEIIVFGFQELVELDNKTVTAKTMFQSNKRKKEKEAKVVTSTHISGQYKAWQDRLGTEIAHSFGERYNLVHSNNMVGLFTCVFVRAEGIGAFRSVKSNSIKTGLGGLHGNKGGLAVRLMIDDSSLCFVNCHLAAGQSHSLQRNKDIETILETRFLSISDNSKYIGKGIFANGGDGTMILDHEFCFFSGDMNYRLSMHRQVAISAIQEEDYPKLIEADQLTHQLKKNPGHRLRAFQEHTIAFPPTYKFDVGTDQYDTSEKRRVPAWCDRIFYRGGMRITPLTYTSLTVRVSDHRPVMGIYRVQAKTIDPKRRTDAYKASLDRWAQHFQQLVDELSQLQHSI